MVRVQDARIIKSMLNVIITLIFVLAIIIPSSQSNAVHIDECSPEAVDPEVWANKFIDDIAASRFDDISDFLLRDMCIPKEESMHILNLINAWQEAEGKMVYRDLIQETNLGSTFKKLVYSMQSEDGGNLFVEFKYSKYKGEFIAYEFNFETDLEVFMPDW